MNNCYVPGYFGMGDNIYLRPVIRQLLTQYDNVYLRTPWPKLFVDLPNIFPVKPKTNLRTQSKNIDHSRGGWHDVPHGTVEINPRYSIGSFKQGMNVIQAFERTVPIDDFKFDLPVIERKIKYKYAVIRPATIRMEWQCPARNCKPEYIQACVDILKEQGIATIGIADLEEDKEWLEGAFNVDQFYYDGMFSPKYIASLMKGAEVVVSPVGFALPMGIALNVPTFIIYGGFVPPRALVDPRMDLSKYGYASPDPFCECYNRSHKSCQKAIPNIEQTFTTFLSGVQNQKTSHA